MSERVSDARLEQLLEEEIELWLDRADSEPMDPGEQVDRDLRELLYEVQERRAADAERENRDAAASRIAIAAQAVQNDVFAVARESGADATYVYEQWPSMFALEAALQAWQEANDGNRE